MYLSRVGNTVSGPELPFTISGHCLVQFDENCIFIIGGWQNGAVSNKTWIFNPNEFEIKEGPAMIKERALHSCGKMKRKGKTILVVAGGIGTMSNLDSVELCDPKSSRGWYFGNYDFVYK